MCRIKSDLRHLHICLTPELERFISQEQLPESYITTIEEYIVPLVTWISLRKQEKPLVIGINGAQGSGKTTMAGALAIILKQCGYNVATLSIDDFYLTKQERGRLAQTVHPLLKTRGVPGTHDVKLAIDTVNQLISGMGDVFVPKFDKSIDNRKDEYLWPKFKAPVDIVLLEGWCVATPAQSSAELEIPVNELEAIEDKEGRWRTFVNQKLANEYQRFFNKIDVLVFLKAPGFDSVFQWRSLQEHKTFSTKEGQAMNALQLTRFIQHYERLTRVSLKYLPKLADVVFELNERQSIVRSSYKPR